MPSSGAEGGGAWLQMTNACDVTKASSSASPLLTVNYYLLAHNDVSNRFYGEKDIARESKNKFLGVGLFATHTLSRPDLFAAFTFATCTRSRPDIFATRILSQNIK